MIHKKLNTGSSFDLNNSQQGCCGDGTTPCRYSYLIDEGATLTSIVVDGVVIALGGIATTGTASEIIAAITAVLLENGYASDVSSPTIIWNENNFQIDFYSTAVFGNLITSAATETTTANCVKAPLCYYEFELGVSALFDHDIEFGITGNKVGGNEAADYSTGNGDLLATALQTLLDTSFESVNLQPIVKVVENLNQATYTIGIWMYRPNAGLLYVDNEIISAKTCKPDFSSAA